MSYRRRGEAESGFIGQRGYRGRRNSDEEDDVYARDIGSHRDPSGFNGVAGSKYGKNVTGFEGLAANNDDPQDYAQIRENNPREQSFNERYNPPFEDPPKKEFKNFKRAEKPLTHVDRETVGKVVDLKDKYQKLKDRSNDKEKETKVLEMKIEALAERIRDIDKKKNEFKDQLFEEKKK